MDRTSPNLFQDLVYVNVYDGLCERRGFPVSYVVYLYTIAGSFQKNSKGVKRGDLTVHFSVLLPGEVPLIYFCKVACACCEVVQSL